MQTKLDLGGVGASVCLERELDSSWPTSTFTTSKLLRRLRCLKAHMIEGLNYETLRCTPNSAATAHGKADHLPAYELSKQALEHPRNAQKHTEVSLSESAHSEKK